MPIKTRQTATKRVLALLTISAIAGTLWGCGRYGRPVRPKAQDLRIEKPIRNDLRTLSGSVPSVFRSSRVVRFVD